MKHLKLFEDNNSIRAGVRFEIPKGFRVFDNNFPAGEYIINKNIYGNWLATDYKLKTTVSFNNKEWDKFLQKGWFILPLTVDEMEKALRDINFFVGGLTDDQIKYYYNKHII
jgi:hypothetical protein